MLDRALSLHRQGRPDLAEPIYRQIVDEDTSCAEAWHLLGVVDLQRGNAVGAEPLLARAVALEPRNPKFLTNLGNALLVQGKHADAETKFRAALHDDPGFVDAHYNLGTLLRDTGHLKDAEAAFRRASELEPDHADALNNLGALLKNQNRLDEAVATLTQAQQADPDHHGVLWNLASSLELQNRLADAQDIADRLLKLRPSDAVGLLLAARLARRQNRPDAAVRFAERALSAAPDDGVRLNANFELGLALERCDRPAEAFAAFERGNGLQARLASARGIDGGTYRDQVNANRRWFTAERIKTFTDAMPNDDTRAPIFFVGFPRSGTTLFEQILAAHPDIVTTDEVSPLSAMRGAIEQQLSAARDGYPECLGALDPMQMNPWRDVFWRRAAEITNGRSRTRHLVDKLPLNITELGLVNLIFPRAKIIVALRDPRDTCLSCFMQQFRVNAAMANFNKLDTTARLYADVMGLWLYYRQILTTPWIEYRYEDLVADFEGTVRRVLGFLGLDWHEDLQSYRTIAEKRAISTPSYRDVIAPLNARAVARWKKFEREMAPVLPALAPFVASFGYDRPGYPD